jgi:multiple antibiotic resistance protein
VLSLLHALVALVVVVDPVGVAATFAAITHGELPRRRTTMALRGTLIAGCMLLLFFFTGGRLLAALGVSIAAFRTAGGILLLLLAIDMVFARQSGLRSTTAGEEREAEHKADVSVFPLAFPLIAGPGALTTVLLMAAGSPQPTEMAWMTMLIVVVLGATLAALLLASSILRLLGETGTNVVGRVFGLLLAALAVQFVFDGIRAGLNL